MTKIDEILYCPGILLSSICLGQAEILSKVFFELKNSLSIETIHGLVTMSLNIDRLKYTIGCMYCVDQNGFKIHNVLKTSNCMVVTNKVFGTTYGYLDKCLEELGIEPFSLNTKLLKTSYRCMGREKKKCVIVTSPGAEYSLTYLILSIDCSEKSISVKTLGIIDDLINNILNPVIECIVNQCVKSRVEKNKCIEIVDSVDKNLLIYITELISRNIFKTPSDLEISDVINYVKSIIKHW